MHRAFVTSQSPTVALLAADSSCCACASRLAALEQRLARLEMAERGRGPRDAEDRLLLQALPKSTNAFAFRAAWLLRHAETDPVLRDALAAVIVTTPGEVGCWLRRMAGTREGVTIEKLPGRRWRAYDTSRGDV